jgi:apolipoprotein N-acyltransferase
LIGSLGLSVLAGVLWGGLTEIVYWRLESRGDGRHRAVAGAFAAALVLVFTLCYSGWRLSQQAALPGLRVALIQPSQDHEDHLTAANVGELQRLTAQAVAPGSVDLVVWPENAIFTPYERNHEYRGSVEWVTRSRRAWLLFGTQSTDPSGAHPTATALLATPQGDVVGRYDKRILFPFTERLAFPWLEAISPTADEAVRRWTAAAWGSAPDGRAGTESTVFNIETASRPARIWTPLCYDICYPEIARQAIERGAAVFVNISSEGWNGPGVTNSYVGSTVLRAVEHRVGVARCGNTGVSGLFSPTGRIEQLLVGTHGRTVLDVGVLVGEVSRDSRWPTVYAQYGRAFDRVPALLAAIVIGFAWYRRRYRRDRIRDGG